MRPMRVCVREKEGSECWKGDEQGVEYQRLKAFYQADMRKLLLSARFE
jgi:hypothetical protein